jgi:hypothetical protein
VKSLERTLNEIQGIMHDLLPVVCIVLSALAPDRCGAKPEIQRPDRLQIVPEALIRSLILI